MSEEQPLLLIDVDGVLSLFVGLDPARGPMAMVDGIPHQFSAEAAAALRDLAPHFECVWCTGWEERAEEHLPHLLGLPGGWPHLEFDDRIPTRPGRTTLGHWKLAAIDGYSGRDRPLAWIDDAHDGACRAWAAARSGPTLLVTTDPDEGLTREHAAELRAWAAPGT